MKNIVIGLSLLFSCIKATDLRGNSVEAFINDVLGIPVHKVRGHDKVYVGLFCQRSKFTSHNQPSPPFEPFNSFLDPDFCKKALGVQVANGLTNIPDPNEDKQIQNDFEQKYRDFMECEEALNCRGGYLQQDVLGYIKSILDYKKYNEIFPELQAELLTQFSQSFDAKWKRLKPLLDAVKQKDWLKTRYYLLVLKNEDLHNTATSDSNSISEEQQKTSILNQLGDMLKEVSPLATQLYDRILRTYQQLEQQLQKENSNDKIIFLTNKLKGEINDGKRLDRIHRQILCGLGKDSSPSFLDKTAKLKQDFDELIRRYKSDLDEENPKDLKALVLKEANKTLEVANKILETLIKKCETPEVESVLSELKQDPNLVDKRFSRKILRGG